MSKKLYTLVLTLIAIAAVIPVIYAEETGNWEKAPDFRSNDVVWMLAPNQTEPEIGDVVFAVPTVKNTTTPDADDPPQPIITIAPTQPPTKEDNTLLTAALIITISFIPLLLISLLRRKAKATASLAFIAFLTCSMLFTAYNVPAASADQMATSGYKLANPTGMSDYQLHNYTDGSFGVNRMSDWANLVTFVGYVGGNPASGLITPPLAGYSTNASAVWENVFGLIEYGVVESKEVAVGYSTGSEDWQTAIPDDVQVDVSYQGNMYRFANPLNTAGSPYTVSVGTKMLDGNYIAEDSKGRILFTSSNASKTFNDVSSALSLTGGLVNIRAGEYLFDTPIQVNAPAKSIRWSGDSNTVTIMKVADGANCNIFEITGAVIPFFEHMKFDGNEANQDVKVTGIKTFSNASIDLTVTDIWFKGFNGACINVEWNWDTNIMGCQFEASTGYGVIINNTQTIFHTSTAFHGFRITNNYIAGCETVGVYIGYTGEFPYNRPTQCLINDNHIEGSNNGIHIQGTEALTIDGNTFNNNNASIKFDGSRIHRGVVISDNVFRYIQHYGILVAATGNNVTSLAIADNTFHAYESSTQSIIGVQLAYTLNATVSGNHFDATDKAMVYGIYLQPETSYSTLVMGNSFIGTYSTAIIGNSDRGVVVTGTNLGYDV